MDQFNNIESPINIKTRYFADLEGIATTHPEEPTQDLLERAQNYDAQARELIIFSCLAYVIRIATVFFNTLTTNHDELLDLISIGHLALVENLDVALTKPYCNAHLCASARFAIQNYCYHRSDLIHRPDRSIRKQVVSLDVLHEQQGLDLPMPEQVQFPEIDFNHAALYEAINSLTEKQHTVIVRHYGLFGQPEEGLPDLGKVSYSRHEKAIKKLQKVLMK